ncbi:PKD domain-containing protein [Limibacter armeniacum]|uniref:PKD domain-containing protein n=1 Tax=Limibacter armeniacum TaxID=466084 RepID=UPI002FE6AC4E
MKFNRFFIYLMAGLILGLTACTFEPEKTDIGPAPTAEEVSISVDDSDPNQLVFVNTTPGAFNAVWDLGNGTKVTGNEATGIYPLSGEYTVTLTVITKGGSVTVTQNVTIVEDNYALLDREDYNNLTGGAEALNGKNWVWDQTEVGHMGIGPVDTETADWWKATPAAKEGRGAYDDVINFSIYGFGFSLQNNGDTYAKSYMQEELEGMGGTVVKDDDDITFDITLNTAGWGWSIVDKEDGQYLVFTGGAFPSWHVGGNQEYKILKMNEDELQLRTIGGDGNAWYLGFIREGFERPSEPEPEVPAKPIEVNDLHDDFEGNGNLTWFIEEVEGFDVYDNPAPVGINTSAKVAKYTRTGDNEWANAQIQLGYRMDLTTRNVIKVKVFIPTYNDYTSENGGTVGGTLQKKLSLKLQDSQHLAPWETQIEVAHVIDDSQLGQWVELEFDFSAAADRTDFDKIIVQFGGEGHFNPGIFFLDDIELL